jgi:hypothetical protein
MSGIDEVVDEISILDNLPKFCKCSNYDGDISRPYKKHGCWFCSHCKFLEYPDGEVDFNNMDSLTIGPGKCDLKHKIARVHVQEYNDRGNGVRIDLKVFRVSKNYIGVLGNVRLEGE